MAEVHIYFGSQSGTAECFSEELKEVAASHGIQAKVIDLMLFTPEEFAECRIAVLVVSTYGDGEPTDNAVAFHRWASDPRNDGALEGQRYTVMGLGDMNYSKFNNMGAMTDQNLERLGAKRIYARGVGDDSQDIAEDFQKWKDGGLWPTLLKAIAEVRLEGPRKTATVAGALASGVPSKPVVLKPEVHVFFAQEEAAGSAKSICDAFTTQCKKVEIDVTQVHSLADRKSIEAVKKLPKRALVVVIADISPDAICAAAKKLVRNMSLELDSAALADKNPALCLLAVASLKGENGSASSSKTAVETQASVVSKAFERVGIKPIDGHPEALVDAGDVTNFVQKAVEAAKQYSDSRSITVGGPTQVTVSAEGSVDAAPTVASRTRILCAGAEAKEAGEALVAAWGDSTVSVEDGSLTGLVNAAQQRVQVVLAVECTADGSLGDATRGLAAQFSAAPMAMKVQLRQLRFALVAVAATDFGNAGERATASSSLAELTRAAAPISKVLTMTGAVCVGSHSLDLQDTVESTLAELASSIRKGFAAAKGSPAATAPGGVSASTAANYGTPILKMGAPGSSLPVESQGEPSDVLARFYFEAQTSKVVKVKELRQKPNPGEGLSTVEVEIEASGDLKGYTLGGTLSLLPENDPADVNEVLKLLSLSEADLSRPITFVPKEGSNYKVKRPFPTPCSLGDALRRFCDLGRAPTKKMLQAMHPTLPSDEIKEAVSKILADPEALKLLHSASLCCRMHEFWFLLGLKSGLEPSEFLLHCPRQKPREFTIASSPKASPDRITLCVSLTNSQTSDFEAVSALLSKIGCPSVSSSARGRFFGTCSSWLSQRLKIGDRVYARQRPSPLQLPDKDVPIIMVGAGAGVAPFRGFWEELKRRSQTAPAALFFGCRHPEQDWLFKDEMNAAIKLGASGCAALSRVQVGPKRPLTCLFPAFSRPGDGKEKTYVQDAIKAQSASVKVWVEKMGGSVFICGSSAMGHAVLDTLAGLLEGGNERVEGLRKEGRIVAEMWG